MNPPSVLFAVSGTSKQAVAYDYALRLASARLVADGVFSAAYSNLTGDAAAAFVPCDLSNATICTVLESAGPSMVAVYNQRGQAAGHHMMIPVPVTAGSYAVYGPSGKAITAQVQCGVRVFMSYVARCPM